MSMYEPFKKYLAMLNQTKIKITFLEIEKILGFVLPRSAYTYNAWWANGGHSQAKAWLSAGYKVADLDIYNKSVVFIRTGNVLETNSKIAYKKEPVAKHSKEPMPCVSNGKELRIHGYSFQFIQNLTPEQNENGEIKKYYPQAAYDNKDALPLSIYGKGAFCRFAISAEDLPGVYLWVVDGEIIYIGETVGLRRRFNAGYGNISPRNCYVGGQNTNCKMNKMVLDLYEQGKIVRLYFHITADYKQVELDLLKKIKTLCNIKDN